MSLFQVTKKQVIENYELRTMTGDIVSFTPSYSQLLPDPFSNLNVKANIVASQASGTPTPSTPLPITGYSSANITRCGVNLWDEEWESGLIDVTTGENSPNVATIRCKNYIKATPNTNYYITQATYVYGIFSYDENKTYLGYQLLNGIGAFTTPADCCYIRFRCFSTYGTTYNNDISINYPATDTTYHAYNGQTYAIAFGQTVYGGVLDVTRGKLTVTHGYLVLGGEDVSWAYSGVYFATNYIASIVKKPATYADVPNIICSNYVTLTPQQFNGATSGVITVNETSGQLRIKDTAYTDADAFKTAMNSVQLVYELATPFDIDLTPVQINALMGVNNVFADCGKTTVTCLI